MILHRLIMSLKRAFHIWYQAEFANCFLSDIENHDLVQFVLKKLPNKVILVGFQNNWYKSIICVLGIKQSSQAYFDIL